MKRRSEQVDHTTEYEATDPETGETVEGEVHSFTGKHASEALLRTIAARRLGIDEDQVDVKETSRGVRRGRGE